MILNFIKQYETENAHFLLSLSISSAGAGSDLAIGKTTLATSLPQSIRGQSWIQRWFPKSIVTAIVHKSILRLCCITYNWKGMKNSNQFYSGTSDENSNQLIANSNYSSIKISQILPINAMTLFRDYLWWSSHESAISSNKKELLSEVSMAEQYCPLTHQSNLLNTEVSFSVSSTSNACTNKGIRCMSTLRTGCSAPVLDKSILSSLKPTAAFGAYSKKCQVYHQNYIKKKR
jgi:hypothetical protein